MTDEEVDELLKATGSTTGDINYTGTYSFVKAMGDGRVEGVFDSDVRAFPPNRFRSEDSLKLRTVAFIYCLV